MSTISELFGRTEAAVVEISADPIPAASSKLHSLEAFRNGLFIWLLPRFVNGYHAAAGRKQAQDSRTAARSLAPTVRQWILSVFT